MVNNAVDYGVCRLSAVTVMQSPGWSGTQITQLLFGEHYVVLERAASGWLRIHSPVVDKEGWIQSAQHHSIEQQYFNLITQSDFRITTEIASTLLYRKSTVNINIGSVVPLSVGELFKVEEQLAFNGEAKVLSQRRDGEFICTIAARFLNVPERAGGRTPQGIDAEAWIRLVYRIAGYPLDAQSLNASGKGIEPLEALPGDLVVLSSGKQTRPGILISGFRVIHCEGLVRIDPLNDGALTDGQSRPTGWNVGEYRRVRS